MFKILTYVVYFFIVLLSGNVSYANDGYKIAVCVELCVLSYVCDICTVSVRYLFGMRAIFVRYVYGIRTVCVRHL